MLTRDGGQNRAQILGAKIGPSLVLFLEEALVAIMFRITGRGELDVVDLVIIF